MPNARILNTNPRIGVKNTTPHLRVRPGMATTEVVSPAQTFGGAGYMIGMMALTYIKSYTIAAVTSVASSDYKPHIRIRSN